MTADGRPFDAFVHRVARPLHQALVAAFGADIGDDATAEALAYAWEHWDRISEMSNPGGYLYRVGQSRGRMRFRPKPSPPELSRSEDDGIGWVEPGLVPALNGLSRKQRSAVILVHGFGWSVTEVAEMWDVTFSTVQTHIDRGMSRLRRKLGAD